MEPVTLLPKWLSLLGLFNTLAWLENAGNCAFSHRDRETVIAVNGCKQNGQLCIAPATWEKYNFLASFTD